MHQSIEELHFSALTNTELAFNYIFIRKNYQRQHMGHVWNGLPVQPSLRGGGGR